VEVLCAGACVYNAWERPAIQIGRLQRYSTETTLKQEGEIFATKPATGKKVALVGAGHLGSALFAYRGFEEYGFSISAVFDRYPEALPAALRERQAVHPIEEMRGVIRQKKIRIAIVTVPAAAAQEVVNELVEAGVKAILNFAPVRLESPPGVKIRNVDLAVDLGVLSFFVTGKK